MKLWPLCARKKIGHKEIFCKEEGGDECECRCHTYLGCEGCEKEGHPTKKECAKKWEHQVTSK